MIICVYIFSIYLCQNHGKSVMALLCRVLFFMKIVAQLTFDFRSYCRLIRLRLVLFLFCYFPFFKNMCKMRLIGPSLSLCLYFVKMNHFYIY